MFGLPNTSQVADVIDKRPINTGSLSILDQNKYELENLRYSCPVIYSASCQRTEARGPIFSILSLVETLGAVGVMRRE